MFGDVPNIAARVQSAAAPGTVILTGAVHRPIAGLFVVEDRGEHPLKGIEHPLRLYRVIERSEVRGRLAAGAARGLTPFFGRENELGTFANCWEHTREGEGQVIRWEAL